MKIVAAGFVIVGLGLSYWKLKQKEYAESNNYLLWVIVVLILWR